MSVGVSEKKRRVERGGGRSHCEAVNSCVSCSARVQSTSDLYT